MFAVQLLCTIKSKICKDQDTLTELKILENHLRQRLTSQRSKSCGRQPLKILKGYDLLKQTISLQIF